MLRGLILAGAASLLAACGGGGGGGSGGGVPGGPTPANEYAINLRADRVALPANIADVGPGIGVDSPYTTTLYVSAYRKNTNDPIPGGEDVFACNVIPTGLEYGALYYLDGDPEHEVEIEVPGGEPISVPGAYRAVTLDANAGGASFHFHAGSKAGTATITCSVFDPQANKSVATSLQITVGSSTGKASQVVANVSSPNYLYVQNANGPSQLLIQAQILDEAGQPIPDPAAGVNNLYARIVPTVGVADDGAVLRAAGRTGKSVVARSTNGQAPFTLVSGGATGVVLVEILTDRFDNNVDNGMVEEVRTQFVVPVVLNVGGDVGIVTDTSLPDAVLGRSYATVLQASGGVPPYSWTLVSGSRLPRGLSLSADGIVSGTPLEAGIWRFAVRLVDSSTFAQTLVKEFSLTVTAEGGSLSIATSDLPAGVFGVYYGAGLNAEGGLAPYSWSVTALPSGLGFSSRTGIISGTPGVSGSFAIVATVTDATGTSVSRNLTLVIDGAGGGSGGSDSTPPALVFTIPPANATNVERCGEFVVRFNEDIDPVTVNNITMFIRQAGAATVTTPAVTVVDQRTFSIALSGATCLTANNDHELVLTNSIRDVAGNAFAGAVVPFRTGGSEDTTPPEVLWAIPPAGATNVDRYSDIVVRFNEPMDPVTVNTSTAYVRFKDGGTVSGVFAGVREVDNQTYVLQRFEDGGSFVPLPANTALEFVLTSSIRDLAGNQLVQTVVPFSTGGTTDTAPPEVSYTIPADGAVDVSPNAIIRVVFNEGMDTNSVIPASFAVYELDQHKNVVTVLPTASAVIAESDRQFAFAPRRLDAGTEFVGLEPGKWYRVVMSTSPRDLAGNQICGIGGIRPCGTPDNPVVGDEIGYQFEFRVGNHSPIP